MFGWEFPPYNSGGLGVACSGLTKSLLTHDLAITFVLPKKMDLVSDSTRIIFADNDPITVQYVDSLLHPYITSSEYFRMRHSAIGGYGDSLFDEVYRYAMNARKIVEQEKFDIIHAHEWLSFPAGIEAKKLSGKPLIMHVHATEFDRSGGNMNPVVFGIEKEGLEKADEIVAVSEYTKRIITQQYGINPDKISVVHNGVAPFDDNTNPALEKPFNLPALKQSGNKIVLFVGRLTLQKGPDYFIKAAKKVLEFEPHTYFIIAGSGDMERQLMEETAQLGISDKVFFTGFLRGEDLKIVYRAADLFVLSSVSEPFGITTLESMINGTPVLISKQSGVSEALDHVLKVDFWDVDEMAHKIISVLRYRPLMDNLAANGYSEAQRFTWNQAAEKCIKIYDRLTKNY